MPNTEASVIAAGKTPPLMALADLQDHLLTATNDLARLDTLLDGACQSLMERFHASTRQVAGLPTDDIVAREHAVRQISGAVTALQFQDMASQLIAHTCQRLAYCTDQLASLAFNDDDDGEAVMHLAPLRPNPVTQDEMDAGSVDLF